MGIAVKDFDAALGLLHEDRRAPRGYSLKQPDGRPLLTYLHISRDTFLELQPATAALPPGLTHFAVEFGDSKAAVARMRQQGATMADTALTPGRALFTGLRDSRRRVDRGDGVRPRIAAAQSDGGLEAVERRAHGRSKTGGYNEPRPGGLKTGGYNEPLPGLRPAATTNRYWPV